MSQNTWENMICCVIGALTMLVVVALVIMPHRREVDINRASLFTVHYYMKHGYWPSYWHRQQLLKLSDHDDEKLDSLMNITADMEGFEKMAKFK